MRSGVVDIGEILREAREKKKVTCSQAAAATRMKVQHIEAMERNDFSHMAAPAYARGFLRLYADYLSLDPEPLLHAYNERFAPREHPRRLPAEGPRPTGAHGTKARVRLEQMILNGLRGRGRLLALAAGIAAVVMLAFWAFLRVASTRVAPQPTPVPPAGSAREPLPLLREAPDPHLEIELRAVQAPPRIQERTPRSRPSP